MFCPVARLFYQQSMYKNKTYSVTTFVIAADNLRKDGFKTSSTDEVILRGNQAR